MLTAKEANTLFSYDPTTGILRWRAPHGRTVVGCEAGVVKPQKSGKKYRRVTVLGNKYYAHVIIWLMIHGEPPTSQIDHVDGNGLNNRRNNLRLASPAQNAMNRRLHTNNTSGVAGVYRHGKSWRAVIGVGGRKILLGCFKTIAEAAEARKAAQVRHGFSDQHGSKRPI